MYTNHYGTDEYPFYGSFYEITIDTTKPLDQQVEEERVVFSTECDMSDGNNLSKDVFSVFFPFDSSKDSILIKEGDLFKGDIYGMTQRGRVSGIYPSQLGGCTVVLTRI